MHKRDLISGLKAFLLGSAGRGDGPSWKGQRVFATFLISFLEKLSIPSDEKYDTWQIEVHLPQLMVDAFEQLRTGTDSETVSFREEYEADVGHEVPNITELGKSNIVDQALTVQTTLGYMLREATGLDWIEKEIDSYCNAQNHVLQQTFDKFLRLVYRRGLGDIINNTNASGMSGKFGDTEFRTLVTAGRIMFTFARHIDKSKPSHYKKKGELYCNEWSVSFVGEDGDQLGLSAGIQSVYADLPLAMSIIEEVIKNWPSDTEEQKKVYKANRKVSMV